MKKQGVFLLYLAIISLYSCSNDRLIDIQGNAQGTYYSVKYVSDRNTITKPELDAIFDAIDSSLSTYKTYSLISKFNKEDSLFTTDSWFIEMMNQSELVFKRSNSAFDPTVMPLVRAWGFGPEGKTRLNTLSIDSLLVFVGWEKLIIKKINGGMSIKKGEPGMQLDFNAIAQGYASDIIAERLDELGIDDYLIDSGGELRAKGYNQNGDVWKIGIDRPEDNAEGRDLIAVFKLDNKSVATSGNYRKFYVEDGVKYSHTISPIDGKPVRHTLLSATVITDTCSLADAYATALMVMGTEKAIAFIENNPSIEAYLVYSDKDGEFKIYQSKGMEEIIVPR
jgi:thiamine biosynthesis lipoprotein